MEGYVLIRTLWFCISNHKVPIESRDSNGAKPGQMKFNVGKFDVVHCSHGNEKVNYEMRLQMSDVQGDLTAPMHESHKVSRQV